MATTAVNDLIDKVRLSLRITNTDFDGEIRDMISEVGDDLTRLGLPWSVLNSSAKARAAVIAYCHSRYAKEPADRAYFYDSYQGLLDELRRSALHAADE